MFTKCDPKVGASLAVLPNGLFCAAKRAVWGCRTACLASQNGPFGNTLTARQLREKRPNRKYYYKT